MGRQIVQRDPKRAVGYVRVSTEDQRIGPEAQKAQLAEWCARSGVYLVATFEDLGRSGGLDVDKRPGLLASINALELQDAGVLLVAKWDRLARDVGVAIAVERLVEKSGAKVLSADGSGYGDGPEAELMRIILHAFAAYERAMIRLRTRKALAHNRALGLAIGGEQKYGHRVQIVGEKRRVEADPLERETVQLVHSLRSQGLSLRAIVKELDSRQIPVRGSRWHKTTVVRMLRQGDA